MSVVLWLWVAAYLALIVHLSVVAAVGHVLGAQVDEVRLGNVGRVRLREASPAVSLGVVPGGYVRFTGAGDPTLPGYERLPAWRRALIPVTGPLAVLALSAVALGPDAAFASAQRAPAQLFAILDPAGAAPAVLEAAARSLAQPPAHIVGTVLAKLAVFNLLPFPALATGQALLALLPLPERARIGVHALGLVVTLALFVGWVGVGLRWVWAD